ncbi:MULTISPECIES: DUF1659 domain-containing protein [Bacillaceae]|uniref:DUF1659 domain-containing protein n=1 Tax=Evansella alkalicola TaxID=745819 RepID=A0ABS6K1K4_9BACI|nr:MULTISPECIES: DUF1659 domain-containing protein [Bacillaceae]MBU9723255.1 DUF1659 domain-containing protein [Bacillus alkalicola]
MDNLVFSRLTLLFVTGYDEEETPIFKTKHYRNISNLASNEELFATALALSTLQKHSLDAVERSNTYDLVE